MLIRRALEKKMREIVNNNARLTKVQKKTFDRLIEIENRLQTLKKYRCTDFNDRYYLGIKDIEYLFGDLNDYYRPILAKQSFGGDYEFYTCRGDKDKKLQLKEYIAMIIPYLSVLIDEKKSNNQNVQLDMGINLKHSTDQSKNHTMYVKKKNFEALPGDDTNDIIEQLIASFLENYEDPVLESRNGSGYSYDSVEMLDIHFHKIEIKRGSSYTDSPEWLKNKGATINPKNTKDNRCFMYALTIHLTIKKLDEILREYLNLCLLSSNTIGMV